MGWTYCRYDGGPDGVVDYLFNKQRLVCDSPGIQRRVLKTAKVGSTVYAALEIVREAEERQVLALVFLTNLRHQGEIGYKGMDETMGPVESDCPASILKLLTPTDSQWANQWRARCWDNAKKAKERVVKPGEVVLTDTVLSFKSGVSYRVFEKDSRRGVWRALQEAPDDDMSVGDRLDYVRFNLKGIGIAERFSSREAFIESRKPVPLPPVDDTPLVLPDLPHLGQATGPSSQPSLVLDW